MNRSLRFITVVLLCFALGAGSAKASEPLSPELQEALSTFDLTSTQPVRIIVTLSEEPAGPHAARQKAKGKAAVSTAKGKQKERVRNQRGSVVSQMAKVGITPSLGFVFEEALNGFTITLPSNRVADIAAISGVTGIYHDVEVVRHDDRESMVTNVSPDLASSVPTIGAPAAWAAGYTGDGVVIAIIDTGVDYTHPDLGGCFGPSCKVIGGYDFVGLDGDPMEGATSGAPDYHGTHVASTAAGVNGVAPDAKILAIRVLGTPAPGKANNLSTVMAGIEFAVANGADVANMSLGILGTYGQSTNLWGQMVTNAVLAGVVFTNSNGNDGPGYATAGLYASSPLTIGVGNSDARPIPYPRTILQSTGEALIGGSYGVPFPSSLLGSPTSVVSVGYGNSAADYAGKDVIGKIAIAERGGPGDPAFVNKANQAQAAGAAAIIIYNDAARMVDFSTAELSIPSFTMSYPNGLKTIASGIVVIQNFNPGPQMNAGSSRGPTRDLTLKPDVSAPGTAIIAAVPYGISSTGYAALTGTSMAAPHMAGAAALVLEAHPSWTPQQVKLALMNTATNLNDLTGASYRPIDQGAGLAQLARAIAPALSIEPGSVSFGLLGASTGYAETRSLGITPLTGGGTYSVSVDLLESWAGVHATASSSTVAAYGAGASVSLTVSVDPATSAAGDYEGYVTFRNVADPTDSYRIPFHFAHQLVVAELGLSSNFVGTSANGRESVTVTFKIGRPLTNWWLGTMAGTRFTVNQGAAQPGNVTYVWNGRTSINQLLAEGNWNIGVWYQLPGTSTFVFSPTYARFFVDRTAPLIAMDAAPPGLTNQPTVTVTGAIGDVGMYTFGGAAGSVLVNGSAAQLLQRNPPQIFVAQNSELAFSATVTLNEGSNTVVIRAEDYAGNRSTATFSYGVSLDSIAPVTMVSTDPEANANGWINAAVMVSISSADASGSGVQQIRYSLDGVMTTVPASATMFSVETEGIHGLEWSAVDVAGNVEPTGSMSIRTDWTAPLLAMFGGGSYEIDQTVTLSCTASDSGSGLAINPCSSPLLVSEAWLLGLGTHERTSTATDLAGNSTSASVSATITVSFDSLGRLADRLSNGSLGTSLTSILMNAKSASQKGSSAAVNNQLTAFQNHVQAQSGKAFTPAQATAIIGFAESLKS